MFVRICTRSADRSSCVAQTLTLDIARKVFIQMFIPAMLINTIDFYHLMRLSLTLTVAGGHTVSSKHTYQLIRMTFDMVLKKFKVNIPYSF